MEMGVRSRLLKWALSMLETPRNVGASPADLCRTVLLEEGVTMQRWRPGQRSWLSLWERWEPLGDFDDPERWSGHHRVGEEVS